METLKAEVEKRSNNRMQILVVVTNIQMQTLKAEVENDSNNRSQHQVICLVVVANIQIQTLYLECTGELRVKIGGRTGHLDGNNSVADILMIDDPTGANSANTSFMRFLCTHIVDFNGRKLLARWDKKSLHAHSSSM